MSKDRTSVIAIFDIGKTNKKLLLFDNKLDVVYQHEEKFSTILDEDGVECDDLDEIEKWIQNSLNDLCVSDTYELVGVNFSTYGASLVFIDSQGNRLTPLYNYLKEIPLKHQENLFENYGGRVEFCRKTASPALGVLLNSGMQILWLKNEKPEIFSRVAHIFHFPQYLSYKLTGEVCSESTSIGCHTFLWDFDNNKYHKWLEAENIKLPEPIPNSKKFPIDISGNKLFSGIGIHDSSASLVPYLTGKVEPFLLVSTGTWCINMNPFNHTPLTASQLENDCLAYISIEQNPVKSSRLFMGHIHDVNVESMTTWFNVPYNSYKKMEINDILIQEYLNIGAQSQLFFKNGLPENYCDNSIDFSVFSNFDEAYHRFMFDLTLLNVRSINLILDEESDVKRFYISGGFARNEIFVRLLANMFPDVEVYTTEIDNSSAMGAALVIWDSFGDNMPEIDLGLKLWKEF